MTLQRLFIIFMIAFVLRGAWGTIKFIRADDPTRLEFPDEEQYWLMASSLRTGSGLRDELGFRATRMPLYPAALSLVAGATHGVTIARVAQWVVGALAAAITAGAAAALFDRRVGLVAGLLVAFDPFLVFFCSLLLTETAFVTALTALWWMLARNVCGSRQSVIRWVIVGVSAALTVYTRESSLGLIFLAFGFAVVVRRFEPRSVAGAAIATAVIVASLVPWAVRNQRLTGQWCWLTTRAGISLYDGVGPQATGVSDLGNIKQMSAVRDMTEVEWNRYFVSESFKAVRADPGRVLRLAGVKLVRMWNPFPNVETYQSRVVRALSACWTLPTFLGAAVGLVLLLRQDRKDALRIAIFLFLPALYLTLLHSVFVGSVRYRLGAVPMLAILAAFAVVAIADRMGKRRSAREDTVAG
jgi:hypothetical protein